MEFKNRLKGKVTETLIEALLEAAGYRIIPLGVEEVVREVTTLNYEEYKALNLSKNLRSLPDFLVTDSNMSKNWLVEVKYRKAWNDNTASSLASDLADQVSTWGPLQLVVFLSGSDGSVSIPSSIVRTTKLVMSDGKVCVHKREAQYEGSGFDAKVIGHEDKYYPLENIKWGSLSRVQDVFSQLGKHYDESTITKSASLVKGLANLDLFK